jgi:O-antigen ligase
LLAGWALNGFGNWRFGRAKPIVTAMLGCWIWWAVSATFSHNQVIGWRGVEAQSYIFLPFLVGITLIDSIKRLKMLAWVLMLSQAYLAWELNLAYLAGYNRLQDVGFGGYDNNSLSIGMVASCGLAFFLGLHERILWRKALCFFAAALMAHVPMFGFSRGGMLGLIVTGFVTFLLVPKQPKHYAIFAIALLVGLRLAGPSVMSRFSTVFLEKEERDASAQSRIVLWKACIDLMTQHPIVGVGPDNFPEFAPDYGFRSGKKEAHSLWLQQGAELGIPGLVMFVGFYAVTVYLLWAFPRQAQFLDLWYADTARMVISSVAGFSMAAMFVSVETLEFPYYVVLLGAGALKVFDQEQAEVGPLDVVFRDESMAYAS